MSDKPLPPDAVAAMERWFANDLAQLRATPPAYGPSIVMACCAWGRYVGRFMRVALASMLAPANAAALRGRLRLVLYTDAQGWTALEQATRALSLLGIEPPLVRIIPPYVMELADKHPAVKFFILGTAQNLGIRMAGQIDAGFHMLMPDHAHGERFFENLDRLRRLHPCIAHTSISAEIDPAERELRRYRHNGALAVPDRELGDIAWRHLHKQTRSHLMNDMAKLPHSHAIFAWQSCEAVHIYCPHLNVAWLSPELCTRARDFFPATLDTQIPQVGRGRLYVPTLEDGMTYVELSDDGKPALPSVESTDEWAMRVWGQFGWTDRYLPIFDRPSVVPIQPQLAFMDEAEIAARYAELAVKLRAAKSKAAVQGMERLFAPGIDRTAAAEELFAAE